MGFAKFKINKKDVTDGLRSVIDVLPDAASTMLQNILGAYQAIAEAIAPRLTGDLAESHIIDMVSSLDGIMYPTVPYAPYVIYPTRPHEIWPIGYTVLTSHANANESYIYHGIGSYDKSTRANKGLEPANSGVSNLESYTGSSHGHGVLNIAPGSKRALYWPGAAHPVTHVHHPGTPGQDYIEDVFNAGQGNVDDEINNFLDKVEAAWSG